jgi:hypothetical protein
MGETGSDPANTKVTVPKEAPWWVAVAFKFIALLGVPCVVLSFYMYKDYKFEDRRLQVEQQRNSVQEKTNVLLERFEKVLYRVEKKLPDENR